MKRSILTTKAWFLLIGAALVAEQGDAVGFLSRQPDAAIGGLTAIQVVEHMPAGYLTSFLDRVLWK